MTQVVMIKDQPGVGMSAPFGTRDGSGNQFNQRSVQASVAGTGAVSATVDIFGANDIRFPIKIGTITLTGTGTASDALQDSFPWEYYFANVTAISGTGAAVSVVASV